MNKWVLNGASLFNLGAFEIIEADGGTLVGKPIGGDEESYVLIGNGDARAVRKIAEFIASDLGSVMDLRAADEAED